MRTSSSLREFITLVIQIERVMNSRPLIPLSGCP